ncbi:hypothetical protein D9757_004706 [Collybiopsis confluens]|uniref:BRCA2 OB1 domain-containing protein n=1 Tax=Collybiopsis confluens TaxID=2823264 RepID=A0A8H5HS31_9AGAR|nr:hypothetical protein D9757_004706 [Collybiopsis confluens]
MTTASRRRYERSPASSPVRKRQKFVHSSPGYPELELSQDDLLALDEIEQRLSQTSHPAFQSSSKSKSVSAFSGFSVASAIPVNNHDDSEYAPRSSPDPPEEKDFSAWFESTDIPGSATFQTAKSASMFTAASPIGPSISLFSKASAVIDKMDSAMLGFRTEKGSGFIAPSAAALAEAEAKLRLWQDEEDQQGSPSSVRLPLRSVQHSIPEPGTCPPSHIYGFSTASYLTDNLASSSSKPSMFTSPLAEKTRSQNVDPNRPKPFKSPLVKAPKFFITPTKSSSAIPMFSSARSQHPLAAPPSNATPVRSKYATTSSTFTPSSSVTLSSTVSGQSTSQIRTTPAKFVTPFKKGMRPGEVGRSEFEARQKLHSCTPLQSMPSKAKPLYSSSVRILSVFDSSPPPHRLSLQESGLLPQQYTIDDMIDHNIVIEELSQITTPFLALCYSFYTSPQPSDSPSVSLDDQIGPAAALDKLLKHGCSRATKAWVDNAWFLILWKLAGMVALEPERENGLSTFGGGKERPRWSWDEVWKQLLYRYQREMNLGQRPPFHLISTQDHPASPPMVLCISSIIWPEESSSSDRRKVDLLPQLEVTDGWYRLKAQIDISMANAVKRGKLCVGRKIAVLDTERKDPLEPLEAYESTRLVLSGNSCQLAPWHAKLGFQPGPYVFTTHSLTPEGGIVALMDLVVLQVHPIAYLETQIGPDGHKFQDGPRSEADEAVCKEQWRRKREVAESKIYEAHEKKITRYLSYADRLDSKAGRSKCAVSVDPPDNIDSLYDELEDTEDAARVISSAQGHEAAWLAKHIREQLERDQEGDRAELQKEVNILCPPRNIRSFRVLIAQDSRTSRYPANRVAQVTVWDVLDVKLTEGKPGGQFEEGWRCLVTNLMPSAKTAWMGHEPRSQIFLFSY